MAGQQTKVLQRASKSTWMIFMMGVGFSAGGITIAQRGDPAVGYGISVMFGLMGLVAFLTLLPGSNALELSPEGFRTTLLFRKGDVIPWSAVGKFQMAEIGSHNRVVFNFSNPETRATDYRGAVRGTADWGGSLPDAYGLDAASLSRMLNEWREEALGPRSEDRAAE